MVNKVLNCPQRKRGRRSALGPILRIVGSAALNFIMNHYTKRRVSRQELMPRIDTTQDNDESFKKEISRYVRMVSESAGNHEALLMEHAQRVPKLI